ncbi:MAG: glyceraldehyde 3-phosphate dehydrogenase NAD-binding domain-containing protein, partial [Acetobacteraceae bacterium]
MAVRVGINGFGRIGRLVLRAIAESGREDVRPVAINDLGSADANAHLFRYDSVHGRFPGQVIVNGQSMEIRLGNRHYGPIRISAERDPTKLPFGDVDVALECTGLFTNREAAASLLAAGARKVLVS